MFITRIFPETTWLLIVRVLIHLMKRLFMFIDSFLLRGESLASE
jgi:hypothetical protein